MIHLLKREPGPLGGDTDPPVCDLDEVRKVAAKVYELAPNAWLAFVGRPGDPGDLSGWLHFGLFTFHSSDGERTLVTCDVRGEGSAGTRELRHTHWGDGEGYIFYPDWAAFAAALPVLREYFDL